MSRVEASDPAAWQARCALDTVCDHHPGLVINRPGAAIAMCSKPYQLSMITAAGLKVPATLLTNHPDQAHAFIEQTCDGRAVYKSASDYRSIVSRVGADELKRLDLITSCPTQFQKYVPGVDVRVHVIGEHVFASEVTSDAVDYRYARRDGRHCEIRPTTIPDEIQQRCLALTRKLGLTTAGIDLRRTPDGDWVCFEVNPSPAFTYYQAHTGQAIGDALADLLTAADTARA